MTFWTRAGLVIVTTALITLTGPLDARQRPSGDRRLPDYDIRDTRAIAPASPRASSAIAGASALPRHQRPRLDAHTGALRVLVDPGANVPQRAAAAAVRNSARALEQQLGLDEGDLNELAVVRDYYSRSTGLRHVVFAQSFDGIPVLDAAVTLHIGGDGRVVRVTSSAARGTGRVRARDVAADRAAAIAASNIRPDVSFSARPAGAPDARGRVRFPRGGFAQDVSASPVWFPMDGGVRLAWHVEVEPADGDPQLYDVMVDAATGELLLRRNRVLYEQGSGRVLQSDATAAIDPRQPDKMPSGGGGCPPPDNYTLRSLTGPFRDSATVLSNTGLLIGNNAHVYRGSTDTEGAAGVFDGTRWLFDFDFDTSGAAEVTLFHALNFAHDFFYDLGFDEAAGNFQVDNFGRGGLGGDSIKGIARAAGRNNATFQPASDGTSPIIRMFLWDGLGCWAEDVDGDGSLDLDGDFDLDIVLHEYHHGVSHRLNTAFSGNEAGAIGEGGSDFFAYSVNGDTLLAEYARPGGLRTINDKGYGDWSCLYGFSCEVHNNGEIWANVMWDFRERLRTDGFGGSGAAAINESHQLYVDGLKLSPPSPTMLDMRDAILAADALRNPDGARSQNFCRIWETFATRGMGTNATDTEDNGFNMVTTGYLVPDGCQAPPSPPTVALEVTTATATEAGPSSGIFTLRREAAEPTALSVNVSVTGTAVNGADYLEVPGTIVIPAGAAEVQVLITPVDDATLESNEIVTLALRTGGGYVFGTPRSGTVTIISDDTAPDLVISALSAPQTAAAGAVLVVTDTTKNQGTNASVVSTTSFYLSENAALDAADPVLGSREVPALAIGATSTASTSVALPSTIEAGTYYLFAKADGPTEVLETQENNNTRLASVRVGPDLAVSALTAPASAGPGVPFTVTETTKNQGAAPAGSSSTRFFLSANYALDAGDLQLSARSVPALDAGASSSGTTTLTLPDDLATGLYYLIAAADDGDRVLESLETNNTRSAVLRVGPDLVVSALSAPLRAGAGTTVSVTDTTKNNGSGAAGASTTSFYLSSNLSLDAADLPVLPSRPVPALAAGATSTVTTAVVLPSVPPGTWYLLAVADQNDDVFETNETNNVKFVTMYIGPDLVVSSLVAPSTATAGAVVSLTDTVKNNGSGEAGASVTRYYLSLNTILDETDRLLDAERSVPALPANTSSTGSVNVTLPSDVTGKYYLIAVADGGTTVAESNESNNTLIRLITIN